MGAGPIIGIISGAVLAVVASIGLTGAISGSPKPVDTPYVVYGQG